MRMLNISIHWTRNGGRRMKDEELREKYLSGEDIYPGKIIRVQK